MRLEWVWLEGRLWGCLCRILWVKLLGGGYRNEWQFLRGTSLGPARCQENAVGQALWNLWVSLGQGSWLCRLSCWPLTPPPPPPGAVDDVLDSLCTVHGSGNLHRHLYFLVCMQGVCGLWGDDGPLLAQLPG